MRELENLVFKGGGVLGIAYAGAIEALEENKLLDNIKRVAGTSAGSIVAALVSLRYTSKEITDIVHSTDFKSFEDHKNPLRIPTKYGLYKGDAFLNWMKKIIKDKTGDENTTFAELHDKGYRELKVFATDLNMTSVKEFSNINTPDVIVAESIRASMSIPLFFSAWKFSNNNPDNHIYVDGGTVYNYPITCFKDQSKTLGFFLFNDKVEEESLDYDEFTSYIKLLFKTLMKVQDIDFEKDKEENAITVKIDDFGISATDFDLTDKEKVKLFNSGKKSTIEYINKQV